MGMCNISYVINQNSISVNYLYFLESEDLSRSFSLAEVPLEVDIVDVSHILDAKININWRFRKRHYETYVLYGDFN